LLIDGLVQIPGLNVVSRTELLRRSGIVSFRSENLSAAAVHAALSRAGIICVVRDHAVRLSPHFYQGEEEISRILAAVRVAVDALGTT